MSQVAAKPSAENDRQNQKKVPFIENKRQKSKKIWQNVGLFSNGLIQFFRFSRITILISWTYKRGGLTTLISLFFLSYISFLC